MTAVGLILSLAILAMCALCRPSRARCPVGYDLRTGIRRDGYFQCWPNLVGDPASDHGIQPEGVITGRLHCTGGAQPIAGGDGRTVGCRR